MDIVGIGRPIKDLLLSIESMPPQDSATRLQGISSQGGGKVATAMVAASRLGMDAAMIGVVGDDKNGRFVRDDFEYNGVDTSHLLHDPGHTSPFCVAIGESQSRTRRFLGLPSDCRSLQEEDLDFDFIGRAKILHLESGDAPSLAAARHAREKGMLVSIDADHYREDIETITPLIDIFIGSEFYYDAVFGDLDHARGCEKIAQQGCRIVIFTLGKEGCIGIADGKPFELPIVDVPKVIDTTGAGDVFHGAYDSALLRGLDPIESARFASAVSAIKCTRLGGRAAIPDWETTRTFLATGKIPPADLDEREAYYRQKAF